MSDDRMTSTAPGEAAETADLPRRALLAGAGAAGAAVLLAGCGSSDDDKPAGGDSAGAPAGSAPTAGAPAGSAPSATGGGDGGTALAKTSEIPVGGGKIFAAQRLVVTQPAAGQFKAFSAICTHQGCPVSKIESGTIICRCHNSRFAITDGSVKGGPAPKPLEPRDVTVKGDNITLA
ncbi:Rieske (2Fe-2S) protein [Plantactinospora siamensis]|uniref:Cytochrome bc1 complex Rieske iron-sulfur subunit n=1 Tax=Plantactinospora siamensis TaxID=555372 RepID=A0ABV6NZ82_9ACTN